jgi:signal peptidase I
MIRVSEFPWKRLLSNVVTAMLALVMVFTVLMAYGTIANRFYRVITIDGNSMAPTFHYGDQVIVLPPKADTPPGTIVLLSVDNRLVTHRLLRYENGMPITQGDANLTPDDFSSSQVKVMGTYWFHIPKTGYISLYIKQLAMRFRR